MNDATLGGNGARSVNIISCHHTNRNTSTLALQNRCRNLKFQFKLIVRVQHKLSFKTLNIKSSLWKILPNTIKNLMNFQRSQEMASQKLF